MMDREQVRESVMRLFNGFLESMDNDQLRLMEYAMQGLTNTALRDLSWSLGRKAGRIQIALS